jgi:hypothetical protein
MLDARRSTQNHKVSSGCHFRSLLFGSVTGMVTEEAFCDFFGFLQADAAPFHTDAPELSY